LIYNLKIDLFILITLVYSAELLTDFSYVNFTVSYRDALDRLHVHLNIILLHLKLLNQWICNFVDILHCWRDK